MEAYILLVKAHCQQYKKLLKCQLLKRLALSKNHRRQHSELRQTSFRAAQMAFLIRAQTSEILELGFLAAEEKARLRQMHREQEQDYKG